MAERSFSVRLEPRGWIFDAACERPVLESASNAGLIMPSSCRNGTCRACICQLVQGEVTYCVDWPGLSAEEKAERWILPCVSLPQSTLIIAAPKTINQRLAE